MPDATRYRVQIASSRTFEEIHYEETLTRGASISLSSIVPQDVVSVWWRVRAEAGNDASSHWSNPAHFRPPHAHHEVENTPIRVDAAPIPLHPDEADARPVDPVAARFSWDEIPEASGYQIQVSDSPNFDTPVVDITVDRTTSVILYDAVPTDKRILFWRARPLFPLGAPGPWSRAIRFSVATRSRTGEHVQPEDKNGSTYGRASGPVLHGRTSRKLSLIVPLLAIVTFLATLLLIATAG